ncbi:MAG: hypothetical protein LBE50_05675 [Gallionellaceae bacterium]|jgi:hypothetical protein|nr:hypothetical protein [Gallionellaceae bacterium]
MKCAFLALAVVFVLPGCASIVNGQNQSIAVTTIATSGTQVTGANCKLENPKGTWFVTTPGSVTVHRAYDDLSVQCSKEGEQSGIAFVKSSTKAMAFGNVIFGGVIGAGVDMATGSAYDYPQTITVQMDGQRHEIAPPPQESAPAQSAPPADSGSAPEASEATQSQEDAPPSSSESVQEHGEESAQ